MRDGNEMYHELFNTDYYSFGSTYEGWKPPNTEKPAALRRVLDLPMRDGNGGLRQKPTFRNVVLDLPMRDGNILGFGQGRLYRFPFWIYL